MSQTSGPIRLKVKNSGQIVVEYVLLLTIAVAIAVLITSTLVSRSEEDQGFLIVKWREIIATIGADWADDPNPPTQDGN